MPRKKLLLIVSLIAVSTVLFVIGVVVERQSEPTEAPGTHQEASGAKEGSGEVRESGEAKEGAEAREAKETKEGEIVRQEPGSQEASGADERQVETILGINLEATWAVVTVIIAWLVLAVGLLLFGSRFPIVLILVTVTAAAATAFDTLEVLRQLSNANGIVATIAIAVALCHAAIAVLAVVIWHQHSTHRNSQQEA
ncbi:MAG: hypothetical protein LC751_18695 [Actinobacteria bacterium]|nr:hypothetical protein [Actinomycetota bacterium]